MNALPTDKEKPDRGPDGEAFRTRPYALSQSAAVSRGSVAPGQSTELLRMTDTTLIDRMWARGQFSDREHRAAKCLLSIFTDAGLNPRVVGNLPYVHDETHEREENEDCHGPGPEPLADGETWRDRYRSIMRGFDGSISVKLDGLMLDQHPGMKLGDVQTALGYLGDVWGFERDGL